MEAATNDRIFKIQRNLSDAGCDDAQIAHFLELEQKQRCTEHYRLLSKHRAALLEALHRDQYKIDCLDHMVYVMGQEDTQ